jgi:2-polyprenyl-3-methyl-5-hydroxy-6-metoxy-1,4-benzoquinol methylase
MLPEVYHWRKIKLKNIFLRLLKLSNAKRVGNVGLRNKINIAMKCVADVCEYLNINPSEFAERQNQWPNMEEALWNDSKGDLEVFYKSWNGEYAGYNICCNAYNQLLYNENFDVLAHVCESEGTYLDYGCGTAALAFRLFLEGLIKGKLVLLDVKNDTNKFIEWRIKKYGLEGEISFYNIEDADLRERATALFCIDVLEHLPNSTEVFIEKIHPLIEKNGLLVLRAPWRGQLTHLDAAADDFYCNGGRKFLAKRYAEYYRFANHDIGAVYRKIKD